MSAVSPGNFVRPSPQKIAQAIRELEIPVDIRSSPSGKIPFKEFEISKDGALFLLMYGGEEDPPHRITGQEYSYLLRTLQELADKSHYDKNTLLQSGYILPGDKGLGSIENVIKANYAVLERLTENMGFAANRAAHMAINPPEPQDIKPVTEEDVLQAVEEGKPIPIEERRIPANEFNPEYRQARLNLAQQQFETFGGLLGMYEKLAESLHISLESGLAPGR